MIFWLQTFILSLTGWLQMGVQGAFILVIFNRKINWKRLLIFSVTVGLVSQGMRLALPEYLGVLNLAVYVGVMTLSMYFLFQLKIYESILAVCLTIVMSAFAEYASVSLAQAVLQNGFDSFMANNSFPTVLLKQNLATVFAVVVALALAYYKFRIVLPADIKRDRLLGILANGLVTVIVIVPNILYFLNNHFEVSIGIVGFNSISILIMFGLSVFNTFKQGELESKKQEVEFQKQYIDTLNNVVDGLRGFKHDYNNMVQVIGGYLALNDLEGLKKYHFHMQKESTIINSVMPINEYLKDNPALYGLILSKFTYSEVKNVIFRSNISSNISFTNINMYDFCKVLGILLDNAIEAATESDKKQVELYIHEHSEIFGVVVEVSNTYSGVIDQEDIFKNGFTTKKDHSGFGLWEVKKIVTKYNTWSLKTKIESPYFTQQITIQY